METWVAIAKWLLVSMAVIAVVGALVVGFLAWMLNHAD